MLPGGGARRTFANVSSYFKGINGIMVDLSGSHGTITTNDLVFKVGIEQHTINLGDCSRTQWFNGAKRVQPVSAARIASKSSGPTTPSKRNG